jgi:hypothetical protein
MSGTHAKARAHRWGGRTLQLPACDKCTQGVMDTTNSHYLGLCECECQCQPGRETGSLDAYPP